jgi:DNA mismatch endonuclease (patch repair protein)
MGLRYRKNVKGLPGKPDIVFSRARVVVFCDGDFWHGRNWLELSSKLRAGSNSAYWLAKIASNMERDRHNTVLLEDNGWLVIRIWEAEIRRDPTEAAYQIATKVQQRRQA